MRIIAGKARGARLFVPSGREIRPLTDLMRGAIFSRLGGAVVDAVVLDLFAGTGAFGLEALSRGAAHVILVDRAPLALEAIRSNVARVIRDKEGRTAVEIVCDDVFTFVKKAAEARRQFDIIFAGPPYAKTAAAVSSSAAQKLLQMPALGDILASNGWLISEHFKKEPLEGRGSWRWFRTLRHGDTRVEFFARPT